METKESGQFPRRYILRLPNRYGLWSTPGIALRETKRILLRRVYSMTLRLRILRHDLRSFLRHIGIVFSKELYGEPANLALCLLSLSNERHPCRVQKDAHKCGICSLYSCYPEASFHDARLFLAGFLAADERSLAEVRDNRDFCKKQRVPREHGQSNPLESESVAQRL